MSARCALEHLVAMFPRWAALTNEKGTILIRNEGFAERFGRGSGHWLDLAGDGTGTLRAAETRALEQGNHAGAEAPLPKPGGGMEPVWCDIYPLHCESGAYRVIVLHSTEYLRRAELAYLHSIRRATDDNLWIADADGRVIWMRVGTDNPLGREALGRHVREMVAPGDRATLLRAAREAAENPGTTAHLYAQPLGADSPSEIDLVYLPSGLYGARYYAAARKAVPRGNRIVERLMEAYQVSNYTALAERMGVGKSTVSRAAHTDSAPAELLLRCHDDTGVSLDWLVTGQGRRERW